MSPLTSPIVGVKSVITDGEGDLVEVALREAVEAYRDYLDELSDEALGVPRNDPRD